MWNPWRALGKLTHVTLHHTPFLPTSGQLHYPSATIRLRAGMTQAERRSVLTHELVHLERGPTTRTYQAREEAAVEQTAARRLISLDALADALAWCYDEHEAAEELWVDVHTVRARLNGLSAGERTYIETRLDGHGQPF